MAAGEVARDARGTLLRATGLALLYAAVLQLGLSGASRYSAVATLWSASGVALWILLRWGLRLLPAVLVPALAIGLLNHPAPVGVLMGLVETGEALLGAWLLTHVWPIDLRLERVRDVGRFVLGGAAVAAGAGALAATLVEVAFDGVPWARSPELALRWASGDGGGVLVVGAALLTWTAPGRALRVPAAGRRLEALAVALGAVALGLPLVAARQATTFVPLAVLPLAFLLVIWGALRFGTRGATAALALFAATALAATVAAQDVFVPGRYLGPQQVLQTFIGVLAVTGLVVAAATVEHRRARAALERVVSTLEATLDSTADGILVVDREGHWTRANRRFAEMWRMPPELLEQRDDRRGLEYVLDQLVDPEGFFARVQALYAEPEAESFDELRFKDGRILERLSQPQRAGARVVGRVWSFRDVTRQRQLESGLRESHTMEAVGRLAGGVAHDFNNLLTVIIGHCELLGRDPARTQAASDGLAAIGLAARRASELTRQLLAFGRRQVLAPQRLDLGQLARESSGVLARLLGEPVELVLELADELPEVSVDRAQLQQVLLDLVLHARDAMPAGGRLVLRTETVTLDPERLAPGSPLAPGRHVALLVSDTGAGMDAEACARLFEPFYTTRALGRGSGLGLSTAYGIVRQSGGELEVTSAPGQGTTFRILLPCAPPQTERPPAPPAAPPIAGARVLLVEDESSVRNLLADGLRVAGFEVWCAADGIDALEVARRLPARPDLLVSDVAMPGLGGVELATALEAQFPGLRVLLISGFTGDLDVLRAGGTTGRRFLQKPFTSAELVEAVRCSLAGTPD